MSQIDIFDWLVVSAAKNTRLCSFWSCPQTGTCLHKISDFAHVSQEIKHTSTISDTADKYCVYE